MRMAHFAAMAAAQAKNSPKSSQSFPDSEEPVHQVRAAVPEPWPRPGPPPSVVLIGGTPGSAPGEQPAPGRVGTNAPAATPGSTPRAPASATRPGAAASPRPPAPAPTTQDNRCPSRWRAFDPDKVTWIESLIKCRPLLFAAWHRELADDADREFLLYMVEHGLSLTSGTSTAIAPFKCNNYKSAYVARAQVQSALDPDILANRIFRPYARQSSYFVHALGAIPETETTVRVIHDHSRPLGRALNDASADAV